MWVELDERWVRFARRHPLGSAVLVAIVVAVGTALALRVQQRGGPGDTSLGAAALGVASSLLLITRVVSPLFAVIATTAMTITYIAATGSFNSAMDLPPLVALWMFAARNPMQRAMIVTASAGATILAASFIWGDHWLPVERIAAVAWLVLGMCIGALGRARARYVEAMEARAAAAESLREVEASQAVLAERLRIARDIHDVAAHHLTAINLQIGTAQRLISTRPEIVETMLAEMGEGAGAALREVKATVGMLRGTPDDILLAGVGMASVPELVAGYRRAGADIETRGIGQAVGLPAATDAVAYRVIREALTNAVRHAPGMPIALWCEYAADRIEIVVTNQLAPMTTDEVSAGRGLGMVGMGERVTAVGGTLVARPVDETFRVTVTLPLKAPASVVSQPISDDAPRTSNEAVGRCRR